MNWVYSIGAGILILPSMLIIVVPLIDRVFKTSFMSSFNEVLSYITIYIGSDAITVLLSCLGLSMFLFFLKWCLRSLGTISK